MTRLRGFVIGALLALSTIALARGEPDIAGSWRLSVGANAPCTLTFASDPAYDLAGKVQPSANCACSLHTISRWRQTPEGLELLAPGGGMVARLANRDGAFEGPRLADGKVLALRPLTLDRPAAS